MEDEVNDAALTKKILSAPLTEADYIRLQYSDNGCILLLYNLGLNRVYGIAIDKETATKNLKGVEERMYG